MSKKDQLDKLREEQIMLNAVINSHDFKKQLEDAVDLSTYDACHSLSQPSMLRKSWGDKMKYIRQCLRNEIGYKRTVKILERLDAFQEKMEQSKKSLDDAAAELARLKDENMGLRRELGEAKTSAAAWRHEASAANKRDDANLSAKRAMAKCVMDARDICVSINNSKSDTKVEDVQSYLDQALRIFDGKKN